MAENVPDLNKWADFSDFEFKPRPKPKSFSGALDDFKGDLGTRVIQAKQYAAKKLLEQIIMTSPVRTGAYVKSHKVGVNSIDATHEPVVDSPLFGPKVSEAEANAIRRQANKTQRAKIFAAQRLFDELYISNSIPYNLIVEYLGWKETPPYHVYSKARSRLGTMAPLLLEASKVRRS